MNADEVLRFPIHIEAADEAVLQALRGLANYAEQSQYKMSSVKGARWSSGGHATFRFSDEQYRSRFRDEANRLLSGHSHEAVSN